MDSPRVEIALSLGVGGFMTRHNHKCPKCDGDMEQGFTVDMGTGDWSIGARHVSKWAPGHPTRSLLFKTRVPRNSLPIGTFRCSTCGYLESYAATEYGPKTQFSLWSLFVAITGIGVVLGIIVTIIRLASQ
jgi:hypothetical protein